MNPKIKKTREELERTKAKIVELQDLVPQLERSVTDMENTEIIRLFRSADIAPADLPAFIASLKNAGTTAAVQSAVPDIPQTDVDDTTTAEIEFTDEEDDSDV